MLKAGACGGALPSNGEALIDSAGTARHDGVVVVEGAVQRAAATAANTVTLDAERVTFVDSAGLRLVLQAQMTASSRGVDFVLARPSDNVCLLYQSPSPRDRTRSRMPSSA